MLLRLPSGCFVTTRSWHHIPPRLSRTHSLVAIPSPYPMEEQRSYSSSTKTYETSIEGNNNADTIRPYFARGQDNIDELAEQLSLLVDGSEHWNLTTNGKGLEKSFQFDTFRRARVSLRSSQSNNPRLRHSRRLSWTKYLDSA